MKLYIFQAQDKYQRELMLHAADVSALSALKEQLESHNDDVAQGQADLQAEKEKLLNAKTAWQEQEKVMKAEVKQLEKRCEELQAQNSTLHDQMQTVRISSILLLSF